MSKPNSNPSVAARIDAVVAAMHIEEHLQEAGNWRERCREPHMIIGYLRQPRIARAVIRKSLDTMLDIKPTERWRACWIRLYVGEIETALGLPLDPRSAEAIAAWATRASWRAYTDLPSLRGSAPESSCAA